MQDPKFNFIESLSKAEATKFKQRMTMMILATDMHHHAEHFKEFKNKVETLGIAPEQDNGNLFIDHTDSATLSESQQQLLNFCMHTSDLSTMSRSFNIGVQWVYLLFDEFFDQGDMERSLGLEIQHLCDRETVNVVSNQPGFITHLVLPQLTQLSIVLPGAIKWRMNVEANLLKWQSYQETEQNK